MDRETIGKGIRFGLVGGFVCLVDLAMLWVWSRFTSPVVAVSAAYFIAVTVHFCQNKWWVFRNQSTTVGTQVLNYALTVAACWLCTVAVFSLSLRWVTMNIFIAKIIAVPPTTLLSFVMMRWFVFRHY